mgnify:CR=1 FL=1
MTGNTLTEFMDDLLAMDGPEKEFVFRGKRYFMEAQPYEKDITQTEFVIFECFGCAYMNLFIRSLVKKNSPMDPNRNHRRVPGFS